MIMNTQERQIISIFNQGNSIVIENSTQTHHSIRSDVALIYNDRAVLENHHVSAGFRLMRIDDYNILSEFSADEYK